MKASEIKQGETYAHEGMDLPRYVERLADGIVTYTAKDLGPFEMPVSQFAEWARAKMTEEK